MGGKGSAGLGAAPPILGSVSKLPHFLLFPWLSPQAAHHLGSFFKLLIPGPCIWIFHLIGLGQAVAFFRSSQVVPTYRQR